MRRITVFCTLIALLLAAGGCAGISTYPARPNEAHGIRLYPQKIYLLVDKQQNFSKLVSLPDIKNAYDVKPWSVLSQHDFNIKIEEAQVKEVTSKQDSSAALALLQKIVELAAKAAEEAAKALTREPDRGETRGVMEIKIDSAFGFETGIYELDETGVFKRVGPPEVN